MTAATCQVFDIVRGSLHDGPGLRTTVFLKGCPLRCSWCQNPEGLRREREIGWDPFPCIRCLDCAKVCPAGALVASEQGMTRDRSVCALCGACVTACPTRAMDYTDREWTLDALLAEALKDREYYRTSGGGVTVSGGEPLCQAAFVRVLFQRLQAQNVPTALDTCGLAPQTALAAVLAHTDHVLFDLKLRDPGLHERYTGQSNRLILENLIAVAEMIRTTRAGKKGPPGHLMKLWLRTPLIPGVTATAENLAGLGAFIREHLADVIERWELCAFNNACLAKYRKLGLDWAFDAMPLMGRDTVEDMKNAALATGFAREKLVVSGLIAK